MQQVFSDFQSVKFNKEWMKDKKLIEDFRVEEAWKIHPKAVKIYAKGVCGENAK